MKHSLLVVSAALALLGAASTSALAQSTSAGSTRAPASAGHGTRAPATSHATTRAPAAGSASSTSTSSTASSSSSSAGAARGGTPAPATAGSSAPPAQDGATVTRTGGNNASYDFHGDDVQGNNPRNQGATTTVRPPASAPGLIRHRDTFRNETLRGVENQP